MRIIQIFVQNRIKPRFLDASVKGKEGASKHQLFIKLGPESPKRMWEFSKKHVKTRWLILIVGLKTMETFCKVILLNLSLSITWLIWTKIQVSRALLDSGNNPIKFFIPSIRFCGFEELETFSNWGIRASVSTGSGSSLTYCKYTEIKWLKNDQWLKLKTLFN